MAATKTTAAAKTNGAPAKKKPERILNLNAARAARAEAEREPVLLEFGDETFTLPVEMPYDLVRLSSQGDLDGAILSLFDGDQKAADRLYAQKPTMDDLHALVDGLADLYGVGEGK